MTDPTLRIKNLSIALEALSRINNEGSPQLYDSIETALNNAIEENWKEQNQRRKQASQADTDEEIPF